MSAVPLAERMRPQNLMDFFGQKHLVGPGKIIPQMIHNRQIVSMLFWGPPGVGKTTLANLIARELDLPFFQLSAINSGVKDIRAAIESASKTNGAILFIDEIHRFSKSQQDSLLGAVERGIVTLIGATTENPSFEVINALLSRCQVYVLESLAREELIEILQHAIDHDELLKTKEIDLQEPDALLALSGGDARKTLNLLELIVVGEGSDQLVINNELAEKYAQQKTARYDKDGEQHYDIISAFIKSMRGSDPNATLYWLARMTEGGEDPKFIARRMLILASEDIGNANPTALVLANTCFEAVTKIGYPECDLILSQTAVYLACSDKSNASYTAIRKAQKLAKQTSDLEVPLHLRNAPTKLMKQLNYGQNYKYAHDFSGNFVDQEFLPDALKGRKIYDPGSNAREEKMRRSMRDKWGKKYDY